MSPWARWLFSMLKRLYFKSVRNLRYRPRSSGCLSSTRARAGLHMSKTRRPAGQCAVQRPHKAQVKGKCLRSSSPSSNEAHISPRSGVPSGKLPQSVRAHKPQRRHASAKPRRFSSTSMLIFPLPSPGVGRAAVRRLVPCRVLPYRSRPAAHVLAPCRITAAPRRLEGASQRNGAYSETPATRMPRAGVPCKHMRRAPFPAHGAHVSLRP